MQNLGQYFTFNTSKSCRCDSFKALWSSHSVFRMNTLGENQKCERRVKRVGFHSGVMICILSCPAEVMFSMPVDTPDASTAVSSHMSLTLPHTHTHTHTHTPSISHLCASTTPAWISLFLVESYLPHVTAFLPPCDSYFIFGLFFIVQITMISYSHLYSLCFLINSLWRIQSRLCYCSIFLFWELSTPNMSTERVLLNICYME